MGIQHDPGERQNDQHGRHVASQMIDNGRS